MSAPVVCLGQRHAGDDAVGLVVGDRLEARGVPVVVARDAADLVDHLATADRIVIVDAVVGPMPVGAVLHLGPDAIAAEARLVSSHAFSVRQAVGLARALHGERAATDLHVVAVAIARPAVTLDPAIRLSPAVAAAVEPAARLAEALAGGERPRP